MLALRVRLGLGLRLGLGSTAMWVSGIAAGRHNDTLPFVFPTGSIILIVRTRSQYSVSEPCAFSVPLSMLTLNIEMVFHLVHISMPGSLCGTVTLIFPVHSFFIRVLVTECPTFVHLFGWLFFFFCCKR